VTAAFHSIVSASKLTYVDWHVPSVCLPVCISVSIFLYHLCVVTVLYAGLPICGLLECRCVQAMCFFADVQSRAVPQSGLTVFVRA